MLLVVAIDIVAFFLSLPLHFSPFAFVVLVFFSVLFSHYTPIQCRFCVRVPRFFPSCFICIWCALSHAFIITLSHSRPSIPQSHFRFVFRSHTFSQRSFAHPPVVDFHLFLCVCMCVCSSTTIVSFSICWIDVDADAGNVRSHVNTELVNINSVTQSKSVQTYSYFRATANLFFLSFVFSLASVEEYEKLNSHELFKLPNYVETKCIPPI